MINLTNVPATARLRGMKKTLMTLATVSILALAGCGDKSHADAPTVPEDRIITLTNVHVVKAADGFRNVYFGCQGSNEVFITSAGSDDTLPSSVFVIPNADDCVLDKTPG